MSFYTPAEHRTAALTSMAELVLGHNSRGRGLLAGRVKACLQFTHRVASFLLNLYSFRWSRYLIDLRAKGPNNWRL